MSKLSPTRRRQAQFLLKLLDRGHTALETLTKEFGQEVERRITYKHPRMAQREFWKPLASLTMTRPEYRLVEKPNFKEFRIGEHTVSYNGDAISVGCKKFHPDELLEKLLILSGGGSYQRLMCSDNRTDFRVYPNRTGVWTHEGCATWEDVDILIKALQKLLERKAA